MRMNYRPQKERGVAGLSHPPQAKRERLDDGTEGERCVLWLEPAQYPATSQPASSSPQTETAAASKRERPLSLRCATLRAPLPRSRSLFFFKKLRTGTTRP